MNEENEIQIGQLWWDKDRKWCDGSDTLGMVHLVLSRDKGYWKTAMFMWVTDGYCGASIREFIDKELKLMYLIDSISTLKSF